MSRPTSAVMVTSFVIPGFVSSMQALNTVGAAISAELESVDSIGVVDCASGSLVTVNHSPYEPN